MSFDALGELNWLAVIVGAVVYFALGALWYSPPFLGRAWQRSIGWDPEATPPEMKATTYLVPFLAYLVMAIAVGLLASATGTDTLVEGLVLGLVVGVGLNLMHTLVDATFDPGKPGPWTWFGINGSYHTIGLITVSVIVAIWR